MSVCVCLEDSGLEEGIKNESRCFESRDALWTACQNVHSTLLPVCCHRGVHSCHPKKKWNEERPWEQKYILQRENFAVELNSSTKKKDRVREVRKYSRTRSKTERTTFGGKSCESSKVSCSLLWVDSDVNQYLFFESLVCRTFLLTRKLFSSLSTIFSTDSFSCSQTMAFPSQQSHIP